MPTGSGGGGVTSSSNTQLNSLGVGVAADGTAGDITLLGGGALRTGAGSISISPANQQLNFNTTALLNLNRVNCAATDSGANFTLFLSPQTFATLPAAAAGNRGTVACVSDSTTVVWGATITGAGTNPVLAFSDGTAWTVVGK